MMTAFRTYAQRCCRLVAVLLLTACGASERIDTPDEQPLQVVFRLAMENRRAGSRATWGDDYDPSDPGTEFDNRIRLGSLRTLVFTTGTDAAFVGEVGELEYRQTAHNLYEFYGTLRIPDTYLKPNAEYRIMVFANCGDAVTAANLGALTYDRRDAVPDPTDSAKDGYIPMWGVRTVGLELFAGDRQDIGTIYLLRAVAKIELALSEELAASGCTIAEASLDRCNGRGYCLPTGYGAAADTREIDLEKGARPLASLLPAAVAFDRSADGSAATIYLPEYAAADGGAASIRVVVDQPTQPVATPYAGTIRLGSYAGGKPTGDAVDLLRNHIYRYEITDLGVDEFVLQYTVCDWEDAQTSGEILFE